jgi:hypothetical protein
MFVLNMITVLQALTAECVLTKFEKARYALLESLHQLEETLPEAFNSQVFTGHVTNIYVEFLLQNIMYPHEKIYRN